MRAYSVHRQAPNSESIKILNDKNNLIQYAYYSFSFIINIFLNRAYYNSKDRLLQLNTKVLIFLKIL